MTHRLCQTPAGMLMQQVKDSTMVGGKMIETNYFEKRENGETGSYLHVLSQLSQPCPHRLYNSLTIHHTRPCIHRIGRLVWTHYQRWWELLCATGQRNDTTRLTKETTRPFRQNATK